MTLVCPGSKDTETNNPRSVLLSFCFVFIMILLGPGVFSVQQLGCLDFVCV